MNRIKYKYNENGIIVSLFLPSIIYLGCIMYFPVVLSLSIMILLFVTVTSLNQVYNIVHEKAELAFYQKDFVDEEIKFIVKKINFTHISLSTKFTMAIDLLDRKLMLKISVDKLSGSEYKRTGTSVSGNICKAWQNNIFGLKDMISKYGNFNVCELKKGVTYYVNNFIPDSSNFPKFLPYGNYRMILDCSYQNTTYTLPIFLLHWYAKVEKVLKF